MAEPIFHKRKKADWSERAQKAQVFGVLAIPVSIIGLLITVWVFYQQQSSNTRQATAQQSAAAAQQLDQERQSTLDNYLSEMSDLVINKGLNGPDPPGNVVALAVAQTDTAVRFLDGPRRGILIRYLWESGLINGPAPVINLYQVNLNWAQFSGANLKWVNLSTDHLYKANFSDANAYGAYLYEADLVDANLSGANLSCLKGHNLDYSAGLAVILSPRNIACIGNLAGADLSGAYLRGAELNGANLIGADLADAHNLADADLQGAMYNSRAMSLPRNTPGLPLSIPATQWPTGFDPAQHGAVCVVSC